MPPDAFDLVPADSSCRLLVIGDGPLGERLRAGRPADGALVGYVEKSYPHAGDR
ncbi:MAG: hypothetical protein R2864_04175 [Syntrophotaleaceae bacterium]